LACADAVIEEDVTSHLTTSRPLDARRFSLHRTVSDPVPLEPERGWICHDRRVVALAGIAEPARFTQALSAGGWTVVDALNFGDHHHYSSSDLSRIAAAAARAHAPVLTTAKDAMRLLPMRPLPAAVAYVPLAVAVQPETAFRTWLFDRLREARS
jgi:tetraacyldisaccharide-1-P 4'-kinase